MEIFLTIINGFQPLITNIMLSILDFASVLDPSLNTIERLKLPFFLATCIFKYFDFLERSNLKTVMDKLLTDWNAIVMKKTSKLHYSAILSSTN